MPEPSIPTEFAAALDALLKDIRRDRSILAAILCGSLAHDTVWARSDIDLVLVTIDDRKVEQSDLPINAEGVNVHALLLPRAAFRKIAEGAIHNSLMHSFLAKGRVLYTHDQTIADLCARLQSIGGRDAMVETLRAGTQVLPPLYKARKWFVTRKDYAYTALWLLYAAVPLAKMEVIAAGLLADREVVPRAAALNPPLFDAIYTNLLRHGTERVAVEAALQSFEAHMSARAATVFAPVLAYLADVGDVRSSRDLEDHFHKSFDIRGITTACEYLSDLGLIGKASVPALLTRRSNTTVEELAFFSSEPPDER